MSILFSLDANERNEKLSNTSWFCVINSWFIFSLCGNWFKNIFQLDLIKIIVWILTGYCLDIRRQYFKTTFWVTSFVSSRATFTLLTKVFESSWLFDTLCREPSKQDTKKYVIRLALHPQPAPKCSAESYHSKIEFISALTP